MGLEKLVGGGLKAVVGGIAGLAPSVSTAQSEKAIRAAVAQERADFEAQREAGAPITRTAGRAIEALSGRDFEAETGALGSTLLSSRLGDLGAGRSTELARQTRRLGAAGTATRFNRGFDIARAGVQAGGISVNPNLAGTVIQGVRQQQTSLENLAGIRQQGIQDVLGGLSTGAAAGFLFRGEKPQLQTSLRPQFGIESPQQLGIG